jgi:Flp pilus assembly pilin Flp
MTRFERRTHVRSTLSVLRRDESGQDLLEYAFVAAIIALGAAAAMTNLGSTISSALTKIGTSLSNAA